MINKVLKLPKCDNSIVIPVRRSGSGYECVEIRCDKWIGATKCYIPEYGS
jgi:hypothetical protein